MSIIAFLYAHESRAALRAAADMQNRINRAARGERPACACELALEQERPQVTADAQAVRTVACTCGGAAPRTRRSLLSRISLYLTPAPALPVL